MGVDLYWERQHSASRDASIAVEALHEIYLTLKEGKVARAMDIIEEAVPKLNWMRQFPIGEEDEP